jgi:hypothetical protein
MSIFKKLFNISNKPTEGQEFGSDFERSKYMTEETLPIDERFISNFTRQGGRFLYCLTPEDIDDNFTEIINEHGFINKNCYCPSEGLKSRFSSFNVDLNGSCSEGTFFLSTCEYIIADTGALLFTSNQVKEYKPAELPPVYIIIASASQIVESIGEGLRGIKAKTNTTIPSNITTLKHFREQSVQEQKDLMHYGAAHKTVYLLLLEDL